LLFVDLTVQIGPKFKQLILKLFLESVQLPIQLRHLLRSVLPVLLDLAVDVDETLLKTLLGSDPRVLHIFEVLRHVFHLAPQLLQVLIFLLLGFNHLN
jgi:hypothetical protein